MFNERMEAEAQLRSNYSSQQSTPAKKSRAQTAGQSPGKRRPAGPTSVQPTVQQVKPVAVAVASSSVSGGPVSKSYESRGLTEIQVENEHLRTVDVEIKRERAVTQSVQDDNAMLRQ